MYCSIPFARLNKEHMSLSKRTLPRFAFGLALILATTAFGQDEVETPARVATRPSGYYGNSPDTEMSTRMQEFERQLQEQSRQITALMGQLESDVSTAASADASAAQGAVPADAGYVSGSDLKMSANWKDGLEISTKNKDFRVHVGGRTQLDTSWYSADQNLYTSPVASATLAGKLGNTGPAGGFNRGIGNTYGDGMDFRRARFRIDGTMYEQIEWAAEYDFVNSVNIAGNAATVTAPTDLWWMFKETPIFQNVKIGNQKEAIGFEHMVSSRFLPFMERSYNQDAFYGGLFNGFEPGITSSGTYGEDDVGTFNVGVFKPTNNVFAYNSGTGDYALTARVTRLLMWADDGHQMVHVGASVRQATATRTNIGAATTATDVRFQQFRTRDALRAGLSQNWPTPANITLTGDDMQWYNLELAAVSGPFTLQAEYLWSVLHNAQGVNSTATPTLGPVVGNANYSGGYIQTLYYLTGDNDHYGKKAGFFERVRPNENFFWMRGADGNSVFSKGAWQVGLRYDYLDLNDKGLNGGVLNNITGGLNWFMNPNMKLQFNYIATHRHTGFAPQPGNPFPGDGWVNGWGVRMAHDF